MSICKKIAFFATSLCLATVLWTGSADAAEITVKSGDTLWAIANKNGTSVETIKKLNSLSSDSLKVGQALNVPDRNANQSVRPMAAPHNASRGMLDRTVAVLDYAKQYIGVPYRSGGVSPSGFDCSGFVRYIYKNFGFDLVHTAAGQSKAGTPVTRDELAPGDLVFFNVGGSGISHTGIYVGDNQFIHASTSRGIRIDSLYDGYWSPKYCGATRIL